jgi:hypothetical protein
VAGEAGSGGLVEHARGRRLTCGGEGALREREVAKSGRRWRREASVAACVRIGLPVVMIWGRRCCPGPGHGLPRRW